jgi:hypothetical protein
MSALLLLKSHYGVTKDFGKANELIAFVHGQTHSSDQVRAAHGLLRCGHCATIDDRGRSSVD